MHPQLPTNNKVTTLKDNYELNELYLFLFLHHPKNLVSIKYCAILTEFSFNAVLW